MFGRSIKIVFVFIIFFSTIISSEKTFECHPLCKTCNGKTLIDCTSCFDNSTLVNRTCSCDEGFYMDMDFSCKELSQNTDCLIEMNEYYNEVEIVNWSEFDADSLLSTLNIQISPALPKESKCFNYDLVGVLSKSNLTNNSYIQLRNWTVNNYESYSKISLITKRDDFIKIGCVHIFDEEKDSFKCEIMLRFLYDDLVQETYDFFLTTSIQRKTIQIVSFTSPANLMLGTCLKSSCNMSSLPESELTFCKDANCLSPSNTIVFNQDEVIFIQQKLLDPFLRSTYDLNSISFIIINGENGEVLIVHFNQTKTTNGIIFSMKLPLSQMFGLTLILKSSMNKKNEMRVLRNVVHQKNDYDRLAIENRLNIVIRARIPNDSNLFHFPNIKNHFFVVIIFMVGGIILVAIGIGIVVKKTALKGRNGEEEKIIAFEKGNTSENNGIKNISHMINSRI